MKFLKIIYYPRKKSLMNRARLLSLLPYISSEELSGVLILPSTVLQCPSSPAFLCYFSLSNLSILTCFHQQFYGHRNLSSAKNIALPCPSAIRKQRHNFIGHFIESLNLRQICEPDSFLLDNVQKAEEPNH